MAYDKIIPVTSRLDHCVEYIKNPEKTDLSAELEYITNENKTIGVLVAVSTAMRQVLMQR